MNKEINLVRSKSQTPFAAFLDKIVIIRVIAFGLLSLVTSLSIAFFLLVAFSPLPSVQQEERKKLSEIQNLQQKKGVVLGVQDRLQAITQLLKSRSDIAGLIESIEKNLNSGMELTTFSVDKKLVKLQVSSSSLTEMNEFIKRMSEKQPANFTQVLMSDLAIDQQKGIYIISMTILL